jgi:diguanylate cyclase (GGDEF)-like protein
VRSLLAKRTDRTSGSTNLEAEAPAFSEAEATFTEAPQRGAVSLHQRYYALLRRSRLMAVAFWAATVYFLFWAIPWLPGGLSKEDYNEQVTLTLVLGAVCVALGIGTLILRDHLRRTREALLAWTTVYDDTTGLYNRRYFYDRLSLECERARRRGTPFSLVIMRLEDDTGHNRGPSAAALRRLAADLSQVTRSNDLVALLGGNELAVAAMGVSRRMAPQVVDRLRRALERSLPNYDEGLSLRLGVATYGSRARDPSTLLRSARRSLSGKLSLEDGEDREEMAA